MFKPDSNKNQTKDQCASVMGIFSVFEHHQKGHKDVDLKADNEISFQGLNKTGKTWVRYVEIMN